MKNPEPPESKDKKIEKPGSMKGKRQKKFGCAWPSKKLPRGDHAEVTPIPPPLFEINTKVKYISSLELLYRMVIYLAHLALAFCWLRGYSVWSNCTSAVMNFVFDFLLVQTFDLIETFGYTLSFLRRSPMLSGVLPPYCTWLISCLISRVIIPWPSC